MVKFAIIIAQTNVIILILLFYNINLYFNIINIFIRPKCILIAILKIEAIMAILIKIEDFLKIKLNDLNSNLIMKMLEILNLI